MSLNTKGDPRSDTVTPRERVYRALRFESPDRAPRQINALSSVHMFAESELAALNRDFPSDFGGAGGGLAPGDRRRGRPERKGRYVDDWGSVWEVAEDGVVGEVKDPPLAEWSELDRYQPPWERIERADWDAVVRSCDQNVVGDQRFVLAWPDVRLFERLQFLRGTENVLMDMGEGTANFFKLRDMVHEFNCTVLQRMAQTNVDALMFMDDWGSQQGMLVSPQMWRDYFRSAYRDYCDIIRGGGKQVFMHSDGQIAAILPELVDLGVDALNAQLFCMDIEELARRYKGRITFWGEIDRQQVLPFGTIDDVRKAVGRVRRALDDGTGGVIAMCEWGLNDPVQNIRAVYEAWMEPLEKLP